MSQFPRDRRNRISRTLGLVALLCALVVTIACSGAIDGSHQSSRDPLGLGIVPGPLGSPNPQVVQIRVGSEPSDRIVSLSLTVNSLETTNSGAQTFDLLTAPVTLEFARSSTVTEPVVVRTIYQDTYSGLILPAMTGQVVFYDDNGQLTTQALNISGQTVTFSPDLVLGTDPLVFSVSLDLAQSFTVNNNTVAVNSLVVTAQSAVPAPPIAPAVGQPETGSVNFLVGTVTAVDTNAHVISLQPFSGDLLDVSYDVNTTLFANCDPSMLTNMMIETQGATQTDGTVLATRVDLIENSQSSSELYGSMTGLTPDGINYNLVVDGGLGVNASTNLLGQNVTIDWLAAGYSINDNHLDLSGSPDLVFDEVRTFPGQLVEMKWDSLLVPDPDGVNAGFFSPRMIELEEQTVIGQVSNHAVNGTFTLTVAADSAFKFMNPGLISITVRQVPQTYLRNSPTFNDGDTVKVRGLIFVHPDYSNVMQHPGDPFALVMVADRISK